jgi:hypothetical protein
MLIIDDIKTKRAEEVRAANSYIYEKYTPVEIKKARFVAALFIFKK